MKKDRLTAIDLAMTIFRCVLEAGQIPLNRSASRSHPTEFIAQQQPGRVVMEAYYSSHYWARRFQALGDGEPDTWVSE